MNKTSHTPTRICPHRWCKPLHIAPVPFALAVLAFDLWHNWIFLVTTAIGGVLLWLATKSVHYRHQPRSGPVKIEHVMQNLVQSPGPVDLEMEDARYEGTGWRVLEVRKGWARVAVGCDILFLTVIGLVSVALFSNPGASGQAASSARLDGSMIISLLVGGLFVWFTTYAHKKATQPRKPKRAWVPAFLRTST